MFEEPAGTYNPHLTAQPLAQKTNLPTRVINCAYSGVPLVSVTALCSLGWPMLSNLQTAMYHPVYGHSLDRLISEYKAKLQVAEDSEWQCYEREETDLRLLTSAIMYAIGAMWIPPEGSHVRIEPSLPAWRVVVGSGKRLAAVASWYHFATSKRMKFPLYRVTKTAHNENWDNLSGWIDEAFEIKKQWEKGRVNPVMDELSAARLKETEETVSLGSLYGRMDFNKIWNWVDTQMAEHAEYPVGRRATFKELFLTGDLNPEDWTVDDVEDLQFAITETCDIGNTVTHFINKRLNGIKANIIDFFSTFTIIGDTRKESAMTELEKEKTGAMLAEYDTRVDALEELPPPPKQSSFETKALFYRAQAQWNILKRRYELRKGKNGDAAPVADL
jgi:hypothetical protein